MSPDKDGLAAHEGAPAEAARTWGPYYDALHPQRTVHMMIAWKVVPMWREEAAALWREREAKRRDYEAVHGSEPAAWPSSHPGVVLKGIPACLGCRWLGPADGYYDHDHIYQFAVDLACRHETSDGLFVAERQERLQPTARRTPNPPVVQTPPIPRRHPIRPLRIADRYAAGRNPHDERR